MEYKGICMQKGFMFCRLCELLLLGYILFA